VAEEIGVHARRGLEIFERANDLLGELPKAITGLGKWIDSLWPRPDG